MLRKIAAGALIAGTAPLWLATASAHSIKAEPSKTQPGKVMPAE